MSNKAEKMKKALEDNPIKMTRVGLMIFIAILMLALVGCGTDSPDKVEDIGSPSEVHQSDKDIDSQENNKGDLSDATAKETENANVANDKTLVNSTPIVNEEDLFSFNDLPDFTGDEVISITLEDLQATDESNHPQKMIFKTAHDEMDIEDTWNDGITFKGIDLDPTDNYKDILVTIMGTDVSYQHLIIRYNQDEIINYGYFYNYYPNLYYDNEGNVFYYGDVMKADQLTQEFHYHSTNITTIPPYSVTTESHVESSESRSVNINYPVISGLSDQKLSDKINQTIKMRAESILKPYLEDETYSGSLSVSIDYEAMMTDDQVLSVVFYGLVESESAPHPYKWEYTCNVNMKTGEAIQLQDITNYDKFIEDLSSVAFTPIAGEEGSYHLTDDYDIAFIHQIFEDLDSDPDKTTRYTYFSQEGVNIIVSVSSAIGGTAEYTMPYAVFETYLKKISEDTAGIDWQRYVDGVD